RINGETQFDLEPPSLARRAARGHRCKRRVGEVAFDDRGELEQLARGVTELEMTRAAYFISRQCEVGAERVRVVELRGGFDSVPAVVGIAAANRAGGRLDRGDVESQRRKN